MSFESAKAVDEAVSRINGSAPPGEHSCLLRVELTARSLESFSTADPPIAKAVRRSTGRTALGWLGRRRGHSIRPPSRPRAAAGIALATNVVFKFIDNEFLFRNYALEQIANGDNADHFFAFEHGQVTHTLIGHQGHAYLDRLFWPDMDYVSLHDIPDQRGGGPFAFENDIPGIVSLGYDADQFFTVHHN
jgi:hypothetical protein